jgi:Tol biopolymer transport system component
MRKGIAVLLILAVNTALADLARIPIEERLLGELPTGDAYFCPDSRHLLYSRLDPKQHGSTLNLCGKDAKGLNFSYIDHVQFSRDGSVIAYRAAEGSKWVFMLGEKKVSECDQRPAVGEIAPNPEDDDRFPVLSPDGKHLAYLFENEGKWMVVVDGKESEVYNRATAPTFSAGSTKYGYTASSQGNWFAVINGVKSQPYDFVEAPIVFSQDGSQVSYVAKLDGVRILYLNGQKVKHSENAGHAFLSANGKSFAYVSRARRESGDKYFLVWNGKQGPDFDWLEHPVLSSDGKQVAYWGKEGSQWFLVAGDHKTQAFPVNAPRYGPIFTPNDKHIIYSVETGEFTRTFANEKESQSPALTIRDSFRNRVITGPILSPDGKQIAFGIARYTSPMHYQYWWKILNVPE